MNTCHASLTGDLLTIGNGRCTRVWRVSPAGLHPRSLVIDGRSWLAPAASPAGTVAAAPQHAQPLLSVTHGRASAVEADSLVARLVAGDVTYHFQVFPGVPGISVQVCAPPAAALSTSATPSASGIEGDGTPDVGADPTSNLCEHLALTLPHAHLHQWILADQTDTHDNLCLPVERRLYRGERIALSGNVFAIEDPLSGVGLVLLKFAPLPHARPAPERCDLLARGRDVWLLGHGLGDNGNGYAWIVLGYSGGASGRSAEMHRLQHRLHTYQAGRDGLFLVNTWGDRNRDSRISTAFITQEIAAAAALGADAMQIDDGWQRGITANSVNRAQGGVWQGFWAADADFWQPHPTRLPQGLTPLTSAARQAGVGLGLWFAPDSANDFANWQHDADAILALHRQHGVCQVKIDGVKALSKTAEANLARFFTAVHAGSAGAVGFDLDVTAEIRPGYFGLIGAGRLFLENRYTDWANYHPHATLRNLWQLAHLIPPVRLRIEVLNRKRNPQAYGEDPLAPRHWRADTLFAIAMLASPLGWFEASGLEPEDAASLAALVATWRKHRKVLHTGRVRPLGQAPDGACWCGFLVQSDEADHLVAFRGLGAVDSWSLPLPRTRAAITMLGGRGHARWDGDQLLLTVPEPLDFCWLRLTDVTHAQRSP